MKTKIQYNLITLLSGFLILLSPARAQDPYTLRGSASKDDCHCYTLTPDLEYQAGSVYNKNTIDLTQSFDYKFSVFLGCKDSTGADGIVFILQPDSSSIGVSGNGLGFENIGPSIGIPIDTWQNSDYQDPPYDHTGIYANGTLDNWGPTDLMGPVPALADTGNIEDCQWHILEVSWNAASTTLTVSIDGVQRAQVQKNIVNDIFSGNPNVYWGFSAGTGSATNVQRFCTSLTPGYSLPTTQKTCAPALITFQDSSVSFGSIAHWYWDFGDGTSYDGQSPPPHAYPTPGLYNVELNILGSDGCLSDTLKRTVIVGSKPVAGFSTPASAVCSGIPIPLTDLSTVQYGSIAQWNWDFNNGDSLVQSDTAGLMPAFAPGTEQIQLVTTTAEGCVSDPFTQSLMVEGKPSTSIFVQDGCAGIPVAMDAASTDPSVAIAQWYWNTGDGGKDSSAHITHDYPTGGEYPVDVYAVTDAGCASDTMRTSASIYQTKAYAGQDTAVMIGETFQLHASGGDSYQWTPATGLNDPDSQNPEASVTVNTEYVVTASTTLGCATSDTVLVKAYAGPAIYMPNAFTPNRDGHNDLFRPVAIGMSNITYFKIYNRFGQLIFSTQNASQGWDGNFQGLPQPVGTYVWMVKGEDNEGKIHAQQGTVVLIR